MTILSLAIPANAGETLYHIKQDGKEGYIDEQG